MSRTRSYRELRVYREAFALAMEVFGVAAAFPDHEKYDLTRQVKRSSRSVCANTAEAWRRRRYPAALVAKIIDAEAEAAETRVHIEFAHACGYLSAEVAAALDARYDRLLARLTAMRTRPEKWMPRRRTEAVARRKVVSHRRPSAAKTTPPDPTAPAREVDSHGQQSPPANPAQAPAREVDSHRQPSPPAPPTQAPAREADSHRRPSAPATSAQARPTKPAVRRVANPHRAPPSPR